MKKFLFPLAAVLFLSACSDDDDNSTPSTSDVVDTVTQGTWRITSFVDDGIDHTNDFTDYEFTFDETGVLMAISPDNTVSGDWSVTPDDDSGPDFNIFFAAPPSFEELSEDWDIIQRTNLKIKLRDDSSDGSIDTLTFEKI